MSGTVNRRDAISAGIVMVFAIGIYATSRTFPQGPSDAPGAGLYPAFIAGCLFVLGAVQILQSVVLEPTEREGPSLSPTALKRLVPPLVGLVAYILILPVTGFLVGTIVFVAGFMRYSGVTAYWKSVPLAFGVSVILQYVFGGFLHVPLPEGVIPFARLLPLLETGVLV